MKSISKLLAILVAMSMLFSTCAIAAEFPDVPETESAYEAINVLSDFGIVNGYPDGTYQPDKNVTRAEMTALLMRMLNLSISGVTVTDTGFVDVAPDFWAAYDIKTAASQKIINGYGDGKFGPNDPVTYEQAVKMIVAMLGYEMRAASNGGWPNGYLKVARDDLKMLAKTEMTQNQPAPRKIIAQLLFNALEVKLGDPSNGEEKNETLLKDYLKINKTNGMVVSNSKTTLSDSESIVSEDEIMVEGKDGILSRFKVGKFENVKDMLGIDVVVYSKLDDNQVDSTILHVATRGKVETIVVPAEMLEGFTKSAIQYTKEKDGKVLTANLVSNPRYIYNDKYISEANFFDNDLNELEEGTVEIVSSGAGNSLVRVNSYKNYVVKTVDAANNKIYVDSELTPGITDIAVNVDDTINWKVTIKKNDAEIQLSAIKKENIISVKESHECQNYGVMVMEVLVSDKKVTGKITAEEDGKVTISSNDYEISESLKKISEKADAIKYNANGTFYLDAFGKIANVVFGTTASAVNAYLIKAASTGSVDSAGCVIKVMNGKTGTISNINLADRVTIDGIPMNADKAIDVFEATAELTNLDKDFASRETVNAKYSQPIQYITNSSGKITDINTIKLETEEKNDSFVPVEDFDEAGMEDGFKYNNNVFTTANGSIKVNSSTVVYLVPENRYEEKGYDVKKVSYFTNEETYSIEAFDVNDSGIASIIVLYDKDVNSDVNHKTVTFVYNDKTTVSDDGISKTKIRGYNFVNGNEVEYTVENGVDVSYFEKGDIIRFGVNTEGEVNENIYVYADVSEVANGEFPDFVSYKSDYTDYSNYPLRSVYMEQKLSDPYGKTNITYRNAYMSWLLGTPLDVDMSDEVPLIFFSESVPSDSDFETRKEASWKVTSSVPVFVYDGSLGESNKLTVYKDADSKETAILAIKTYKDVQSEACDYVYTYGIGNDLKAIMIIKSL